MSGCQNKTFLLIVFLVGITFLPLVNSFAGRPKVDSLRKELFKTDDITRKIRVYLAISKVFEEANPDSVDLFWKEALVLARGLKIEKPLADVYAQAAFFALKKNQLDQAFLNSTLAAKYYGNSGDQVQYARMKSMIGSICLVRANIAEAMVYYMEVIDLSEKYPLDKILPHVLNNVGNIYMDSDDFNDALGYYIRALQLFRKIGDTANTLYPLLNLGECYYYLGNFEMATSYARQAMELSLKSDDNILEARSSLILGMIHSKQGDYEGAIELLNKGLAIHIKHARIHPGPANIQYSELLTTLGENWFKMGDIPKALTYTHEGYSIAQSFMIQHSERNGTPDRHYERCV